MELVQQMYKEIIQLEKKADDSPGELTGRIISKYNWCSSMPRNFI